MGCFHPIRLSVRTLASVRLVRFQHSAFNKWGCLVLTAYQLQSKHAV
nr:MAG TPA: hypothetical protein [Caudoviricetes sp.]